MGDGPIMRVVLALDISELSSVPASRPLHAPTALASSELNLSICAVGGGCRAALILRAGAHFDVRERSRSEFAATALSGVYDGTETFRPTLAALMLSTDLDELRNARCDSGSGEGLRSLVR